MPLITSEQPRRVDCTLVAKASVPLASPRGDVESG
jgi:hypothetical protein